jgi:uncharacterized protein YoxC
VIELLIAILAGCVALFAVGVIVTVRSIARRIRALHERLDALEKDTIPESIGGTDGA